MDFNIGNLKPEIWPIEDLKPYENNPRIHDKAMVSKVASAINEYGFTVPIIVRSDRTVIDGHLRLKAAKELGLSHIPVIVRDDMDSATIKAFRISINKMAELAKWDNDLLKIELEGLDALNVDLSITGLDNIEIDKILKVDLCKYSQDEEINDVKDTKTTFYTCPNCGHKFNS